MSIQGSPREEERSLSNRTERICPRCLGRYSTAQARCEVDGRRLLDLAVGDPNFGKSFGGTPGLVGSGFLILDRLAVGGMGTVYRAHQASMERDVALKVLTGPELSDPELVERFRREALSLARLHSPHTVTVFERGELESGGLFIAMELVAGRSLHSLLHSEAPIEPRRLVSLATQISLSLAEAHELGIVHRDIKPSNVMVQELAGREHVKVLDFGLAKLMSPASEPGASSRSQRLSLTGPGSFSGTPPYMAPELWLDHQEEVGPATDIYALGVVIHELATGRQPFAAKTLAGFMHKHLYEDPAWPSADLVKGPDDAAILRIIERCLKKRAAERYASVRELMDELGRVGPNAAKGESLPRSSPAVVDPSAETAREVVPAPPGRTPRRTAPIKVLAFVGFCALATLGALASTHSDRDGSVTPLGRDTQPTFDTPAPSHPPPVTPAAAEPRRAPPARAELVGRSPAELTLPAVSEADAATGRLSGVRAIGGLAQEAAERTLRSIEPALARCYGRSGASTELRLHFVLAPEGRVLTFEVAPDGSPGSSMRKCVMELPSQPSFPPFGGSSFSTVSARVGP
ncbi:MAG: protein kinase [Deltaproteobacteria bacterium]|nr:protein kinase [Deltaproteobacteria bacterium]